MISLQKFLRQSSTITQFFDSVRSRQSVSVFGLGIGERTYFSGLDSRKILYITSSPENCDEITENLTKLGRRVVSITSANTNFTFHTKEFGNSQRQRQASLFALVNNNADALVINGEVLCEKFVPIDVFKKSIITIKKDEDIDPDELVKMLTLAGYVRVSQVETGGQFARRGEVVDIFPINEKLPFRVYYFDTVIEKINSFNVLSQYAVQEVDSLQICPNGYSIDGYDIPTLIKEIQNSISLASKQASKAELPNEYLRNINECARVLEQLQYSIPLSSWGFLSAWCNGCSILDYLDDFTIYIDQPKQIYNSILDYQDIIQKTINDSIKIGQLFAKHRDLIVDFEDIKILLDKYCKVSYQSIMTANKFFAPQAVYSIDTIPLPVIAGNWQEPSKELERLLASGYIVILSSADDNDSVQMQNVLSKLGMSANICNNENDIKSNFINIAQSTILNGIGLVEAKLVVLGSEQIRMRKAKRKTSSITGKPLQEAFTIPAVGEYVVHDVHGIGVCEGITQLTVNNAVRDYLVISYKNNAKLYVPTEQMDMLSRYIGADKAPPLNEIGGAQFEKIKQKVKSHIKKLAFDLLTLYREREQSKGIKLSVSEDLYREIDGSFRYELTRDQERAIQDIRKDLASGKIMDRLVVGDVGYGKTEVALRAAFIAAMCGYQVAILAPTTILSEQHYNTFRARLSNFGIEVRCLNRFKTKAEQNKIIQELSSGQVNIICGTHRLLSKDVSFFNLGLLILDEEQRFGVGDKEKIKNIKKNVHVLTLSATPIPRTLHMSLVGIRDISVIETPPQDRMPVQTVVAQYSNTLLITAIERELDRKGQVLIVYPRVDSIDEFASKIIKILGSDVRVGVAHGQMNRDKLESIMMSVYRGEVDVLVATSLIENGIDLPNANTIFVVNAGLFGLSQLYQLRGRVGRSDKLAWAYFTYPDEASLSDTSYLRLSTLLEFTQLGSGFKIAMRDLEMRGAGNLLGGEQHGQMEKVGYDMYCKLLDSEIGELRGEPVNICRSVKLEVDWNASIPKNFCNEDTERMELYAMIASISNKNDYHNVVDNIKDRWGVVPEPVDGLCRVALLKSCCVSNGIERAIVTSKKVILYVALDNQAHLDEMLSKVPSGSDIKVYKKDNWAIFDMQITDKKDRFWRVVNFLN